MQSEQTVNLHNVILKKINEESGYPQKMLVLSLQITGKPAKGLLY